MSPEPGERLFGQEQKKGQYLAGQEKLETGPKRSNRNWVKNSVALEKIVEFAKYLYIHVPGF